MSLATLPRVPTVLSQDDVDRLMVEMGIARWEKSQARLVTKGRQSETTAGRRLLEDAVGRFEYAIREWIRAKAGKRKMAGGHLLTDISTPTIALIVSQVVIDNLPRRPQRASLVAEIGNALAHEYRFVSFKKKLPLAWRDIMRDAKKAKRGRATKAKLRVVKSAVRKVDEDSGAAINRREYTTISLLLLELFVAVSGIVETVTQVRRLSGGRRRTHVDIVPTAEAIAWLEETNALHRTAFPYYLPMVRQPDPWTSPTRGGYPVNIVQKWGLVSGSRKGRRLPGPDRAPAVYDAVNALQNTSWEVNDNVLAVAEDAWENRRQIADFPEMEQRVLPEAPPGADVDPEIKKTWIRERRRVYGANARRGGKVVAVSRILSVARAYAAAPFWYPYKLDFRGRAYPIPGFLQPQGSPLAKGLLRFAEGRAISTPEAMGWFFIHGANCWGLDKKDFDTRIAWVQENHALILSISADPIGNRQWETADKPWQFLAWAFEYAELAEKGQGAFKSKIPIAMDGTNNGLQLFSLLLRDPIGAAATNVSPTTTPADVYQAVADIVTSRLAKLAGGSLQYMKPISGGQDPATVARDWLDFVQGRIPRAATKRPVMVYPYGGTAFSIREYVQEWFYDTWHEMKKTPGERHPWKGVFGRTLFLTHLILDAIAETLVGAASAMTWLRDIAAVASAHNRPIRWTLPTGFVVYQQEMLSKARRIETTLGDRTLSVTLREDTRRVSKSRQQNGLPPNYVHSLDAAVMMLTVNDCTRAGMSSFAMNHDSFATHAADAPALAEILRKNVVDVFAEDRLQAFADEVTEGLPEGTKLPPKPALGTLDVRCVLDSPYFFA